MGQRLRTPLSPVCREGTTNETNGYVFISHPFESYAWPCLSCSFSNLVWTQESFAAFIYSRLGTPEDDDTIADVTRTLWRSFCLNAFFPFTEDIEDIEMSHLTLPEWQQAIVLLTVATSAVECNFQAEVFGHGSKAGVWHQFSCLAILSIGGTQAGNGSNSGWRPPDTLEKIARIVSIQLPEPPVRHKHPLGPDVWEVRSRLERLGGKDDYPVNVKHWAIPYDVFVRLLGHTLRLTNVPVNIHGQVNQPIPRLSAGGDDNLRSAIVKSVLHVSGMKEGSDITFANYDVLRKQFVRILLARLLLG